ncbi:MAG: DEAD/DEAH box helicase [Bacteroidetes bacterium]|nr:DEAD/DEAH box helicase [Bacteroidota bacterium]
MSKISGKMTHPPAAGARLLIRDQEWVVRKADRTHGDDYLIHVTGLSALVRDREWLFVRNQENIQELEPTETTFVIDESHNYVATRLHIECLLRDTPPPDNKLYLGHHAAMDELPYQREPAVMAIERPRPRIMIADGTGLGKTLEAGILIAELIRRGQGKRILVVSLASMLTQFQKELWSRFSIPLVRLDSIGIRQIRDQLPAGHNPFHHFDRAIISIDTLKNEATYKTFLEKSKWDIVVIDEVQNVAKKKSSSGSLRHKLANILTSRCDALIMLSATPHDGHAESFASLIHMLDPTVIADDQNYTKEDLSGKNLWIRRFKKDIDKQTHILKRKIVNYAVNASMEEEEVFSLILDSHHEQLLKKRGSGMLWRTTLEKSILSSPAACLKTVDNRIKKLQKSDQPSEDLNQWFILKDALEQIHPQQFSKYQLLLRTIENLNWNGEDPKDRLLIFTERIATQEFLRDQLIDDLGLSEDAVVVMNGNLSDVDQQQIVDDFGADQSSVRLLISTDVGSEGINLHYHCRRLIHFDIPWSPIRLQQRNGRIDRYGQERNPQIFYFITESENEDFKADQRILEILIEKEYQANQNLGDPALLMRLFNIEDEEKAIAKVIEEKLSKEEAEQNFNQGSQDNKSSQPIDPLTELLSQIHSSSESINDTGELPSLFESDYAYAKVALNHIKSQYAKTIGPQLRLSFNDDKDQIIVVPTNKQAKTALESVINQLPKSARPDQSRFVLTSNSKEMMKAIRKCRAMENTWPDTHYLWPIHPIMGWMTDKIRMSFKHMQAPAIFLSGMDADTFSYLITVLWPNRKGVTIFQKWYLVTGKAYGDFDVSPFETSAIYRQLHSSLKHSNKPQSSNELLSVAQHRLSEAIQKTKQTASVEQNLFYSKLQVKLNQHMTDLKELQWKQEDHILQKFEQERGIRQILGSKKEIKLKQVQDRFADFKEWIESSMTMENDPYIQIVALILAEDSHGV